MSRVELFEKIRRDRDREGFSIRELACRHVVHRRTVRQALGSAVPPARKRPEGRPAPALGAYRELIDSWLEADSSDGCRIPTGSEHDHLSAPDRPAQPLRRPRRSFLPSARWGSELGPSDMLGADTKRDCRYSSNPRITVLIAIERLRPYASGVAAPLQPR